MIQTQDIQMLTRINDVSATTTSLLVDLQAISTDAPALAAATAKLRELRMLLATAAGQALECHPRLLPLARAINALIAEVDGDNDWLIDGMTEDDIMAALEKKEDIIFALDQARVLGLCLLTHLNTAIITLPKKVEHEPSQQS